MIADLDTSRVNTSSYVRLALEVPGFCRIAESAGGSRRSVLEIDRETSGISPRLIGKQALLSVRDSRAAHTRALDVPNVSSGGCTTPHSVPALIRRCENGNPPQVPAHPIGPTRLVHSIFPCSAVVYMPCIREAGRT